MMESNSNYENTPPIINNYEKDKSLTNKEFKLKRISAVTNYELAYDHLYKQLDDEEYLDDVKTSLDQGYQKGIYKDQYDRETQTNINLNEINDESYRKAMKNGFLYDSDDSEFKDVYNSDEDDFKSIVSSENTKEYINLEDGKKMLRKTKFLIRSDSLTGGIFLILFNHKGEFKAIPIGKGFVKEVEVDVKPRWGDEAEITVSDSEHVLHPSPSLPLYYGDTQKKKNLKIIPPYKYLKFNIIDDLETCSCNSDTCIKHVCHKNENLKYKKKKLLSSSSSSSSPSSSLNLMKPEDKPQQSALQEKISSEQILPHSTHDAVKGDKEKAKKEKKEKKKLGRKEDDRLKEEKDQNYLEAMDQSQDLEPEVHVTNLENKEEPIQVIAEKQIDQTTDKDITQKEDEIKKRNAEMIEKLLSSFPSSSSSSLNLMKPEDKPQQSALQEKTSSEQLLPHSTNDAVKGVSDLENKEEPIIAEKQIDQTADKDITQKDHVIKKRNAEMIDKFGMEIKEAESEPSDAYLKTQMPSTSKGTSTVDLEQKQDYMMKKKQVSEDDGKEIFDMESSDVPVELTKTKSNIKEETVASHSRRSRNIGEQYNTEEEFIDQNKKNDEIAAVKETDLDKERQRQELLDSIEFLHKLKSIKKEKEKSVNESPELSLSNHRIRSAHDIMHQFPQSSSKYNDKIIEQSVEPGKKRDDDTSPSTSKTSSKRMSQKDDVESESVSSRRKESHKKPSLESISLLQPNLQHPSEAVVKKSSVYETLERVEEEMKPLKDKITEIQRKMWEIETAYSISPKSSLSDQLPEYQAKPVSQYSPHESQSARTTDRRNIAQERRKRPPPIVNLPSATELAERLLAHSRVPSSAVPKTNALRSEPEDESTSESIEPSNSTTKKQSKKPDETQRKS